VCVSIFTLRGMLIGLLLSAFCAMCVIQLPMHCIALHPVDYFLPSQM
jgi:hypothetical protein